MLSKRTTRRPAWQPAHPRLRQERLPGHVQSAAQVRRRVLQAQQPAGECPAHRRPAQQGQLHHALPRVRADAHGQEQLRGRGMLENHAQINVMFILSRENEKRV